MKKEAEYRVYVVSANDIDSNYLSLEDMMQWDEKGVITPQAEEFIKKADVGGMFIKNNQSGILKFRFVQRSFASITPPTSGGACYEGVLRTPEQ